MAKILLKLKRRLQLYKSCTSHQKKAICNINWDDFMKELSPEIQNIKNTLIEIPYDFDYED